ncbi:ATP-binding protein [Streptomyces sp. NPDC002276]
MATNVVNHTKGTGDYFELALRRRDDVLVLEVSDPYQWQTPELRKATPEDLCGRGLFLVDTLAESWGVRPRSTGKTVWARLPVHAGEQS